MPFTLTISLFHRHAFFMFSRSVLHPAQSCSSCIVFAIWAVALHFGLSRLRSLMVSRSRLVSHLLSPASLSHDSVFFSVALSACSLCVLLLMILLPASCLSSGPFCCPLFVGWRIPVARFLHLLPHLNFAPPVFFPAFLPAPCSPYAYFLAFFQHELPSLSPTPVLSGSLFRPC